MYTPRGYYTNASYIGFMPDGSKMRFPTAREYLDYLNDLIGQEAA